MMPNGEIAEFGRVELPPHRMATRPVAGRHRADIDAHAYAVALIVSGAPHLRELPGGTEIACAPFGIRLKPPGRQHNGPAAESRRPAVAHRRDAGHSPLFHDEVRGAAVVYDRDVPFGRRGGKRFDQAGATAPRFERQPAPEFKLAVDLEGLTPVDRGKANALAPHPFEGRETLANEHLHQVRVGPEARNALHILKKLGFSVGAEIRGLLLVGGEVRHELEDILDPLVNHTHGACRKPRIAAALVLACALQHDNARAGLLRRKRRAQGRISGPDNDNVELMLLQFVHFSKTS
jgi:hypothetical protein